MTTTPIIFPCSSFPPVPRLVHSDYRDVRHLSLSHQWVIVNGQPGRHTHIGPQQGRRERHLNDVMRNVGADRGVPGPGYRHSPHQQHLSPRPAPILCQQHLIRFHSQRGGRFGLCGPCFFSVIAHHLLQQGSAALLMVMSFREPPVTASLVSERLGYRY